MSDKIICLQKKATWHEKILSSYFNDILNKITSCHNNFKGGQLCQHQNK